MVTILKLHSFVLPEFQEQEPPQPSPFEQAVMQSFANLVEMNRFMNAPPLAWTLRLTGGFPNPDDPMNPERKRPTFPGEPGEDDEDEDDGDDIKGDVGYA